MLTEKMLTAVGVSQDGNTVDTNILGEFGIFTGTCPAISDLLTVFRDKCYNVINVKILLVDSTRFEPHLHAGIDTGAERRTDEVSEEAL